ncbi:MAG: hypothetical protein AABX38_04110 [Candidatus Micrarchaeota archaeon]
MILENLSLALASKKQVTLLIASFFAVLSLLLFTSNAIIFPELTLNPFIEPVNLILVAIVAFLISINFVVLFHKNEILKTSKISEQKATGIFGIFASLFASSCPLCQPAIFAWFGLGSITGFFAELSIYFAIASTGFLLVSLYLNLKSLNGKCEVKKYD